MEMQNGNNQTIMQAFLSHRKMLNAFIMSIVRNRVLAEDIFQDVAMVAVEKYSDAGPFIDFGAWLREIARRKIMKEREGKNRRTILLDPEAIEAVGAAHEREHADLWEERATALETCVERLPERSRHLLDLRYRNSMDFKTVAARLQSTANSVQVVLSKIRGILRECVNRALAAGIELSEEK